MTDAITSHIKLIYVITYSRSEGGFDDEVDGGSRCHRCGVPFEDIDHVFSSDGQLYHQACFACVNMLAL